MQIRLATSNIDYLFVIWLIGFYPLKSSECILLSNTISATITEFCANNWYIFNATKV